ncbi:MAG: heavy-metal-associated domain-containing protein [Ramlibacter sp.]
MNTFEVKDMTCGHCVGTITKAVKALDPQANVQIDLATHRVGIESASIDAAQWADVIKEAGYTPVPAQPAVTAAAAPGNAKARGGCCCG